MRRLYCYLYDFSSSIYSQAFPAFDVEETLHSGVFPLRIAKTWNFIKLETCSEFVGMLRCYHLSHLSSLAHPTPSPAFAEVLTLVTALSLVRQENETDECVPVGDGT